MVLGVMVRIQANLCDEALEFVAVGNMDHPCYRHHKHLANRVSLVGAVVASVGLSDRAEPEDLARLVDLQLILHIDCFGLARHLPLVTI